MSKKKNKSKKISNGKESENGAVMHNALSDLLPRSFDDVSQLSKSNTLYFNNRYNLITLDRQLLGQMYVEHGIVQTLIDQPVDDGFSKGFEILTGQADQEEIKKIKSDMLSNGAMKAIVDAVKWGRLYGGSGIVLITDQEPSEKLDISKINENSQIEYYAADNWELNLKFFQANPMEEQTSENPYNFYGVPLHESRVLRYNGKESPSIVRRRLRGWGVSEVERLVRSFNQYLKNNNVIFELMDEAKVDVYKIANLNTSLLSPGGTSKVSKYVQTSNMLKSYLNALLIDTNDDYDQKQMNLGGLSDLLTQIRYGIAADVKIPVSKLFGISSAGFSSGEDDIENYNSMIEGQVRYKARPIIMEVLKIEFMRKFGYVPDDLDIEWPALRMLNAEQEENVKDAQFSRVMQSLAAGVIDPVEAKEAMNKDNLLPIKIEETEDLFDNPNKSTDFNGA